MEITVGKKLPQKEDLNELHQKWDFWLNSSKVDSKYLEGTDANGNDIINRFVCEKENDYKDRRKRTSVKNLIGPVLNQYNSVVFRNQPERDLRISDFISDVNGRGSHLDDIMRKALQSSLIFGIGPLLLQNNVGGIMSLAQSKLNGESQAIINVDPYALINWTIIDDYLTECIISFVDEEGKPFARYYNDQIVQDIYLDDKGNNIKELGEEIPHGYGSIPVVLTTMNFPTESFVEPLAEIQKSVNNLQSLLSEEIIQNTFSRFVMSNIESFSNMTQEERENLEMVWSSRRLMIVPDQAKVDRISSDTSQADSIRATIKDELEQFGKTSGVASDELGAGASGESRRLARDNFFVVATTISSSLQAAENYLLTLYGEPLGIEVESSFYSTDFEEPNFSEKILELRDILSLDIPEDIKEMSIERFRNEFFID